MSANRQRGAPSCAEAAESPADAGRGLRVLIVGKNAWSRGGEGNLAHPYFRELRARGIEAWLVVREVGRETLSEIFVGELDRIFFARNKRAYQFGQRLAARLPSILAWYAIRLVAIPPLLEQRRLVRRLVRAYEIDVVHQPTPVSPHLPSFLFGLGAPLVIGPLNGALDSPPGLRDGAWTKRPIADSVRRLLSPLLHKLIPGTRQAATLLVANERTRRALPAGVRGEVLSLPENAVDLDLWKPARATSDHDRRVRLVFVGRLVAVKALDLLFEAMKRACEEVELDLEVIGTGPMLSVWKDLAVQLGVSERIEFSGWLFPAECARRVARSDILVLPSLAECGGAVLLEAMAVEVPVIATRWGGPAEYVDETCGILIEPGSRQSFVHDLTEAILRLAREPQLRRRLGGAGRLRIERHFGWKQRVDRILEIYERTVRCARASGTVHARSLE